MNDLIDLYLPLGVTFNFFIYLILIIMGFNAWQKPHKINLFKYKIYLFLIFLVCVISYTGDFYHYFLMFGRTVGGKAYLGHLEEIYQFIVDFSEGEYYLWRAIIWGCAILALSITFRTIKINPFVVWFVFISYGLIFFQNGRVSLAMSILFLGIALTSKKNIIIPLRILGILLIVASMFFHKSMGFGLIIYVLSLICFKLKKYNIILCILLIPILVYLLRLILGDVIAMQVSGDSSMSLKAAQSYLNNDEFENHGIGRFIQLGTLWINFILWFLIIYKSIKEKIYFKWPFEIRIFINFTFFALFISTLFFFDLGFPTKILQLRFAEFSYIPAAIFITSCRMSNFAYKLSISSLAVGFLQCFYNFSYALYIAVLNPTPQ